MGKSMILLLGSCPIVEFALNGIEMRSSRILVFLVLHITGSGVLCLQLGRPEVGRKLYTQGWRQRPVRLLDKVEIIKSIEQINNKGNLKR